MRDVIARATKSKKEVENNKKIYGIEISSVALNRIKDFVRESNKIEGILREPSEAEIKEFIRFMSLDEITVQDLEEFVSVYQPDARLRTSYGDNVYVGNHFPIEGGPEVLIQLTLLLEDTNLIRKYNPFRVHIKYEKLHPFTDGNGRSGRMLWAWQMQDISLGFLHMFYYQTLEDKQKKEK